MVNPRVQAWLASRLSPFVSFSNRLREQRAQVTQFDCTSHKSGRGTEMGKWMVWIFVIIVCTQKSNRSLLPIFYLPVQDRNKPAPIFEHRQHRLARASQRFLQGTPLSQR